MDPVTALAATFDHTGAVLAGVAPEQWDDTTPCTEWDVRALAAHTTGVVENMGRAARGASLLPSVNDVDLGPDPAAQFRAVATEAIAAWRTVDLDGTIDFGNGPRPAEIAAMINLLDTATHTWDLARATGQSEALPAASRRRRSRRPVRSSSTRSGALAGSTPRSHRRRTRPPRSSSSRSSAGRCSHAALPSGDATIDRRCARRPPAGRGVPAGVVDGGSHRRSERVRRRRAAR